MRKLAIIDQVMSAGGVERFLHGLIEGVIAEGLNGSWEIVILRARRNSAGDHLAWPEYLLAPGIRVEYLDVIGNDRFMHVFDRVFSYNRILGIRGTGFVRYKIGNWLRTAGPTRWRMLFGDTRGWIEDFVRRGHFDAVYFSYPYLIDPPRLRTPMVATPHDFIFKSGLSYAPDEQRKIERQMPRWLKACSRLVVSTQFVADELKRYYPAWARKAEVVPTGIPASRRPPTAGEVEKFRREHSLPEQFVLTVGWMVEHKNQKVVFEAVAKLRDRGVHIPVVCVGPNSAVLNDLEVLEGDKEAGKGYPSKILEFCRTEGLKNGSDYFCLGYVDDFVLECLYRCATMLIVPSITEAGSFPGREAARAGCPVVFADTPVHEDEVGLIENNAWTFPVHDGGALAHVIETVANGGEEVQKRVQAAQKIVLRVYTWNQMARGYFSVFERITEL
jgi:glycosyltransferase involved in cell wall biosynthesis